MGGGSDGRPASVVVVMVVVVVVKLHREAEVFWCLGSYVTLYIVSLHSDGATKRRRDKVVRCPIIEGIMA